MNHLPPLYLSYGKKSVAYFSNKVSKTLLVFTHGFNGDAIDTWKGFFEIAAKDRAFSNSDFLFYGYATFDMQAYPHSIQFTRNLNDFINSYKKDYESIIIVAHSLGAIISRYGVINAIEKKYDWSKTVKLYFFAPAHTGATIQNLIFLGLPSFTKLLGSLILFKYPIVNDLKPESPCLNDLKSNVQRYQSTKFEKNLKAIILQAQNDKIVHNSIFCYDENSEKSPVKKTHTSICKPIKIKYELPVKEIKNMIR